MLQLVTKQRLLLRTHLLCEQDKDWIVAVAAIRWRRFRAVLHASLALRARTRRRRKATTAGSLSHPNHHMAAAAAAAAGMRRYSSEPLGRSASGGSDGGGGGGGGTYRSDGGEQRPARSIYTGATAMQSVVGSEQAATQGLLQGKVGVAGAAGVAGAVGAAGTWDVDGEALWAEVMEEVLLPRLRQRAVYEVRTHYFNISLASGHKALYCIKRILPVLLKLSTRTST